MYVAITETAMDVARPILFVGFTLAMLVLTAWLTTDDDVPNKESEESDG